jgi:hypothetical protein
MIYDKRRPEVFASSFGQVTVVDNIPHRERAWDGWMGIPQEGAKGLDEIGTPYSYCQVVEQGYIGVYACDEKCAVCPIYPHALGSLKQQKEAEFKPAPAWLKEGEEK